MQPNIQKVQWDFLAAAQPVKDEQSQALLPPEPGMTADELAVFIVWDKGDGQTMLLNCLEAHAWRELFPEADWPATYRALVIRAGNHSELQLMLSETWHATAEPYLRADILRVVREHSGRSIRDLAAMFALSKTKTDVMLKVGYLPLWLLSRLKRRFANPARELLEYVARAYEAENPGLISALLESDGKRNTIRDLWRNLKRESLPSGLKGEWRKLPSNEHKPRLTEADVVKVFYPGTRVAVKGAEIQINLPEPSGPYREWLLGNLEELLTLGETQTPRPEAAVTPAEPEPQSQTETAPTNTGTHATGAPSPAVSGSADGQSAPG